MCGIMKVRREKVKVDITKYPKLKKVTDEPCRIYVTNHVSFLDIMTYVSQMPTSFIAKKEVANLPFMGECAKGIDCLFVDRNCSINRNSVQNELNKRAKIIKSGKDINNLLIFAEGTTTNG